MKRLFLIAALAALQLTAAAQTINVHLKDGQVIDYPLINVDFIDFSKPENPDDHPVDPQQPSEERAVSFDVYARQNVTRSAVTGDLGISDLASVGIGVFSYYTGNQGYVAGMALPDFLYNEKVTGNYSYGTYSWEYAPIKYWPDNGYVSFFAYAPWTQATSVTRSGETDDTKNIVAVSRNTDWGDPFVKYVVDSNPNTAVDLLWGVAAPNADSYYQGIIDGNKVNVTEGMPFTN